MHRTSAFHALQLKFHPKIVTNVLHKVTLMICLPLQCASMSNFSVLPAYQYLATVCDGEINRGVEIKVLIRFCFSLAD